MAPFLETARQYENQHDYQNYNENSNYANFHVSHLPSLVLSTFCVYQPRLRNISPPLDLQVGVYVYVLAAPRRKHLRQVVELHHEARHLLLRRPPE